MIPRNAVKLSDHFSLHEAECRCCGQVVIRMDLIPILEAIRKKVGPIRPTSWCRCWNQHVRIYRDLGIEPTRSPHVIGPKGRKDGGGWAVDIPFAWEANLENERMFRDLGAVGIGFGEGFTHIDVMPRVGERFRSWVYRDGRPEAHNVVRAA